jgi:hypothetical protein
MALSKEERERFLAEPHVAALSVSAGDTRENLPANVAIFMQPQHWLSSDMGSF